MSVRPPFSVCSPFLFLSSALPPLALGISASLAVIAVKGYARASFHKKSAGPYGSDALEV